MFPECQGENPQLSVPKVAEIIFESQQVEIGLETFKKIICSYYGLTSEPRKD